ncbi:carbon-phosphorus lyase complex subunit PhnI [Billgrantia tianxiuensis]|jgi:alpha-D-ribose 1-methylphosphonate 5-triphosphate synthase subunit PhnI|uniref:Carbon-phosphorus lyase complex subunit PhnI n=1 Tax=Billgrantia tianxiuensis TaxID=2497861 RepID=A0A6I6SGI7_9GAMM|nr:MULTISPECIES: carbon-phosphorus lyase complex subunit PhnI [Halomonas]MCE8035795.1 carbon-phosphorus lyase complex subunit PhnI [Halomonas sp. MCCC 1A11057]QHC48652.1 carbon-phosphorus lyase complex subunit PhnI [Halomonas tianxiuensis]
MYVAVKGGERAIANAHRLLADRRRGKRERAELEVGQIQDQLRLAVDRVMAEASLYDPELAALAIKQASGDMIEAVFLLRAYRTTLPRLAVSEPLDTGSMRIERRISATYKDIPGGQVLGPTYDYTHRLLDFLLLAEGDTPAPERSEQPLEPCPQILELLDAEGLIERERDDGAEPGDITREPPDYPVDRATRLQMLARGDEGYLLALGYSTQRGYGRNHPFAGEIRLGQVEVEIFVEEWGEAVCVGEIALSECQMINQFGGSREAAPQFTRGYGLAFGHSERKTLAMALVDRALRAEELGEEVQGPAQQAEFVLAHADSVEASGFVSHLKLPHYVDFQSELELLRRLRREYEAKSPDRAEATEDGPSQGEPQASTADAATLGSTV